MKARLVVEIFDALLLRLGLVRLAKIAHVIDRKALEAEVKEARGSLGKHKRLLVVCAVASALLTPISGCGFGQIGPETLITAETPCGRIDYRSTKDQAAPGAACRVSPDGSAYLEMGADASSGAGTVARSVAEGIMAGIRAAK